MMLKLKSTWYKPRRGPPRDHWMGYKGRALTEYRAVEYARWLAQRDGVVLPAVTGRADWQHAPGLADPRPCAVWFGAVRIALPHWDHVEQPPTVEYEIDVNG